MWSNHCNTDIALSCIKVADRDLVSTPEIHGKLRNASQSNTIHEQHRTSLLINFYHTRKGKSLSVPGFDTLAHFFSVPYGSCFYSMDFDKTQWYREPRLL